MGEYIFMDLTWSFGNFYKKKTMKNLLFEVLSRNYSGKDWCFKGEEVSEGLWDSNFIWSDLNQTQKPSWEEIQVEIENFKSLKKFELLREKRDQLLAATDWRATVDYPGSDQAAWLTYRQFLRDLPSHSPNAALDEQGNLINVTWPKPPES